MPDIPDKNLFASLYAGQPPWDIGKPQEPFIVEPGLEQFLKDKSLSGDATEEEIAFLKALKFKGKQPSPIYYYRELQNLRDPLHFQPHERDF